MKLRKLVKINKKNTLLMFVVAAFFAAPFGVTNAESIVWSKQLQHNYFTPEKLASVAFGRPSLQVANNVRVINKTTGQQIACGSSVPVGTQLSFEFLPRHYTDISWFTAGGVNDSPYGKWSNGATRSGSICRAENSISFSKPNGADARAGQFVTSVYADYAVHPSARSVSAMASPGGSAVCTSLPNGNADCTALAGGTLQTTFYVAPTYSYLYGGYGFTNTQTGATNQCETRSQPFRIQWPNISLRLERTASGVFSFVLYGSSPSDAVINIPAQTLACPIYIAANPVNAAPLTPQISARPVCVGTPGQYAFGTNDPDGDRVRYLIDWNNDNALDQVSPIAGYKNSGELEFTTHSWRDPGSYRINVAAQDELGNISPWASATANVVECEPGEEPPVVVDDGFGGILPPTEPEPDPNALPTEPLTATTTPSHPNQIPGISYPDGEIAFIFQPQITNTTCKAFWSTRYVSNCKLYKNDNYVKDIDIYGEDDLTPGTYRISCTQWKDDTIISETRACTKNIDFREV